MAEEQSTKERKALAVKYVKKNMTKQVIKQKLIEIVAIPIGLIILYWIGRLVFNIFSIVAPIYYKTVAYILSGVVVSLILTLFIYINLAIADSILTKRASKKFNVKLTSEDTCGE